jgi:mannose-6-phosphate isomerase-like protein (cupin superfamily)
MCATEVYMHAAAIGLALALVSGSASAQQPAAPTPAVAMKSLASSDDVAALIARAKSERKEGQALVVQPLLQLAPYNVNIEYRVAVATANIHQTEAELFYVIDGAATLVMGGTLVDEKRTNAENLSGTGIAGGTSSHIAKGDFVMVPENTAHWLSAIDGSIALMSLHVPRPGAIAR